MLLGLETYGVLLLAWKFEVVSVRRVFKGEASAGAVGATEFRGQSENLELKNYVLLTKLFPYSPKQQGIQQ